MFEKFRDISLIKEAGKKPTISDRVRHAGVDLLLFVAGFQVGDIAITKAIDFNQGAGNLLDQSGEILSTTGSMLTDAQIDMVTLLQENAKALMNSSEVLSDLSWAATGVGLLAALQLTYNVAMVGIETIIDIRQNQ